MMDARTGTLLNRLFGTNFDVMDETKRQQTTKGTSPARTAVTLRMRLLSY